MPRPDEQDRTLVIADDDGDVFVTVASGGRLLAEPRSIDTAQGDVAVATRVNLFIAISGAPKPRDIVVVTNGLTPNWVKQIDIPRAAQVTTRRGLVESELRALSVIVQDGSLEQVFADGRQGSLLPPAVAGLAHADRCLYIGQGAELGTLAWCSTQATDEPEQVLAAIEQHVLGYIGVSDMEGGSPELWVDRIGQYARGLVQPHWLRIRAALLGGSAARRMSETDWSQVVARFAGKGDDALDTPLLRLPIWAAMYGAFLPMTEEV